MALKIRQYGPEDREAVGRICVLTGDIGNDATGQFVTDELLPYVYAYPYVEYAPDLAFVIEAEDGEVVGYIIGVSDVLQMADWAAGEWAEEYDRALPVDDSWTAKDVELKTRGADPSSRVHQFTDEYPAELHIDMLPAAQGGGMGRKLVTTLARALADRGVDGLALGVAADNESAVGFYKKLGFKVLRVDEWDGKVGGYLMGLDIPKFLAEADARA
ncbi:MAG: GNAT family N-acetyltransferase [Scrofimicrobium sp.]